MPSARSDGEGYQTFRRGPSHDLRTTAAFAPRARAKLVEAATRSTARDGRHRGRPFHSRSVHAAPRRYGVGTRLGGDAGRRHARQPTVDPPPQCEDLEARPCGPAVTASPPLMAHRFRYFDGTPRRRRVVRATRRRRHADRDGALAASIVRGAAAVRGWSHPRDRPRRWRSRQGRSVLTARLLARSGGRRLAAVSSPMTGSSRASSCGRGPVPRMTLARTRADLRPFRDPRSRRFRVPLRKATLVVIPSCVSNAIRCGRHRDGEEIKRQGQGLLATLATADERGLQRGLTFAYVHKAPAC